MSTPSGGVQCGRQHLDGDHEAQAAELKEIQRRVAERERQERSEQRWRERNAEIKALEQEMDPILAPRVWNVKNSGLLRLDDELLIMILKMFSPRSVEPFMLRRVCRKFRQLLDEWDLRRGRLNKAGYENLPGFPSPLHAGPFLRPLLRSHGRLLPPRFFRQELVTQFLLRRDMLCKPCFDAYYYTVPASAPHRYVVGDHSFVTRTIHTCTFMERPARYVYCSGCKLSHPTMAFSPSQQQKRSSQRICIAREGVLRVCDHLSLTWAEVEGRIKMVRKPTRDNQWGQFIKALEQIEWVCTHESHNFPCKVGHPRMGAICPSAWLEPTFPRVKIGVDQAGGGAREVRARLTLDISWRPHSGRLQWPLKKGVRQLETDAVGMRELAAFFGQAGARVMLPEQKDGYIPEMLCFDPDTCSCLRYEGGVSAGEVSGSKVQNHAQCLRRPVKSAHIRGMYQRETRHHYTFDQNKDDESSVEIVQCDDPYGGPGAVSKCIATCYKRSIYVGEFGSKDVLESRAGLEQAPTHEWFHAVDRDSYERPLDVPRAAERTSLRPQCSDPKCSRYVGKTGTCHEIERAQGFLSVQSGQRPRVDGVVEPSWLVPRVAFSLRNIPYLVAEEMYDWLTTPTSPRGRVVGQIVRPWDVAVVAIMVYIIQRQRR